MNENPSLPLPKAVPHSTITRARVILTIKDVEEESTMTIGSPSPAPHRNSFHCPECGESFEVDFLLPPGHTPCPKCKSLRWFVEALVKEVETVESVNVPAVVISTTEKSAAIGELVAAAVKQGNLPADHEQEIYDSVMQREALGPTGIGRGFAFPHTRHAKCEKLALTVGFSHQGLEFESLDGGLVYTIALLVSPAGDPGAHLKTLEGISRNLRNML